MLKVALKVVKCTRLKNYIVLWVTGKNTGGLRM